MKIMNEVWKFYSSKFDEKITVRPKIINNRFKKISSNDREDLEVVFNRGNQEGDLELWE